MKCDEDTTPDGCHDLMVERIRYFTGRHMTARDFRDADAYHRTFRHLHNRVLHGAGIACGLEVLLHWRAECRADRVIVRCGLAIDCCGREIVVRRDVVTEKIPWDTQPTVDGSDRPDDDYVLLLCLRYREICTEPVPVLYSPTACSSPSMEDGRIREGYELCWRWVRRDGLAEFGWDDPQGCEPPDDGRAGPEYEPPAAPRGADAYRRQPTPPSTPPVEDPCPDDDSPACCLDPHCPPDHCVPLAIIAAKSRDEMDAQDDIDTSGRRSIAQAREHLTHICWISWEHGGVVKASDLRRLEVRFDRPLQKPEFPKRPGPRGINERTFVVQFGEQLEDIQTEDIDFVEYVRPPYLKDDRRTAVYEIRKPLSYRNHVLHVTLKCDFIVDCRKQAVDGDHVRGRLPSGNRVPGGTFESWFRVVDDEDYERAVNARAATATADAQES